MDGLSHSMQTCHSRQYKLSRTTNYHTVQENRPFSGKRRHFAVTFPHDLHETSRAILSSRRPRVTLHTMSTCCLTSGSIAMSRHASCVGWKGRPKWPKSPVLTHNYMYFEPTRTRGTPAHAWLHPFDADMSQRTIQAQSDHKQPRRAR